MDNHPKIKNSVDYRISKSNVNHVDNHPKRKYSVDYYPTE
jgi:hypothetical protein